MNASQTYPSAWQGTWEIASREIRDQFRDWRIIAPIIILTLFFPLLMNFTAQISVDFVSRYGAPIVGERLIPFLLMVVGFFPISISLVIALESFVGERERLTLEPLLATPLSDSQLYLGKMIASVTPPLTAAYLGIIVYLVGLAINVTWVPTAQLLVQVLLLTTIQAVVMVCGAVVISSQTTSVRAANLLASFIIVPMAMLIIVESMIMFWGRYAILWWIVIGLICVSMVLVRMGLHLFNREELLGRELDVLDLRWVRQRFGDAFRADAQSMSEWYQSLFSETLPQMRTAMLVTTGVFLVGGIIGFSLAYKFTLPAELFQRSGTEADLETAFSGFGLFSGYGMLSLLLTNLRALLLASILGTFSFGVLSLAVLMVPFGIIGYMLGNLVIAGANPLLYFVALILPHGIFEIPAAIIAGAAILQLGMAAISLPKGMTLGSGWISSVGRWARVSIGLVIPLLILAAAVEAFITPRIAVILLTGP